MCCVKTGISEYANVHCKDAIILQPGVTGCTPLLPFVADTDLNYPCKPPPGLEYLMDVDMMLAHQTVELLQAFTGWECNNKYEIKNVKGETVYYAFEKTGTFMRLCCGRARSFTIHITDTNNREVMRVTREFKCLAGCCWCASTCDGCAHEVVVEAPPGTIIGSIKQTGSACSLNYDIKDADGETQMKINGPPFNNCYKCCTDIDFPLFTKDGTRQVGVITKQWSGLAKELFTNADNFGVKFPMNLNVSLKATLFGALFLIDFMAFEQHQNNADTAFDCVTTCGCDILLCLLR